MTDDLVLRELGPHSEIRSAVLSGVRGQQLAGRASPTDSRRWCLIAPVTQSGFVRALGNRLPVGFPFGVAPAAFVLFFLASETARSYGIPLGFCLAQSVLGIRCPGCGVTRSVAALLHGDVAGALRINVAGPVVCAFFVVHIACFASAVVRLHEQQVLLQWKLHSERLLLWSLLAAWLWHSLVM